MQKLMKALIVAFAYMSMPIMAQKTGWDIHFPAPALRLVSYK